MQRPYGRLVLVLVAAGALSFLAGLVVTQTVGIVPCQGEGLACNIDAAIGGYDMIIFAVLGPIIFGVTLLIARNRTALGGAALVLLVPIIGFYLLGRSDHWRYIGFEPYKSLRTFLVMALPPALTVVIQWLILRIAVGSETPEGDVSPPGKTLGKDKSESEPIPFPTE
jgi:hypothetical protein